MSAKKKIDLPFSQKWPANRRVLYSLREIILGFKAHFQILIFSKTLNKNTDSKNLSPAWEVESGLTDNHVNVIDLITYIWFCIKETKKVSLDTKLPILS